MVGDYHEAGEQCAIGRDQGRKRRTFTNLMLCENDCEVLKMDLNSHLPFELLDQSDVRRKLLELDYYSLLRYISTIIQWERAKAVWHGILHLRSSR